MKNLTAKRYESVLELARARHDARFEIDNPPPALAQDHRDERTALEQATGYLWIVWLALALCGAVIAVPHTLAAVLPTVEATGPMAVVYAAFVFAGVELALLSVALVTKLNHQDQGAQKVRTAKGAVNWLYIRAGNEPPHDLSHLPDRKPGSGALLVALLFAASLIFNQADALADLPQLAGHRETLTLISRLVVGALGPGLLLIAGHRFAASVIEAAASRTAAQSQHAAALAAWETAKAESWRRAGDALVNATLIEQGYRDDAQGGEEAAGPFAIPALLGTNGRG